MCGDMIERERENVLKFANRSPLIDNLVTCHVSRQSISTQQTSHFAKHFSLHSVSFAEDALCRTFANNEEKDAQ